MGINNHGSVIMEGGHVQGHSFVGIYSYGELNMSGGKVSSDNNIAMYIYDGTGTMSGGEVEASANTLIVNMYSSDNPSIGYNMSAGGNDNTNAKEKYDLAPEENYDDNPKVITDDISDEEVDEWINKIL